ncbi:LacI family transcriptional regulator [Terriglobus albidus]|jgi:LacI family transcriptional regulator|uniref:LacI family transcriptional regulator n=1 Tax=Terriglobus albidus TaxID=1592106 RepID=A0A5B9E878_9BACT|nr:LacI family DNA-binding transcriptional regulator [Terriglobus albidus]QEE28298.1 LacI family transcriptional regulator [Terriglobus albidus]
MAVRLKDIARDLGVSTVTVSKVLRNRKDVGEKTRQRVLKRMEELQYKPNLIARALISGRTANVGLVVPDLLHPYFGEVAKSLGAVLREHDRALLLASSEDDPEIEQREIRALLTRGVDMLLISSCQRKLQNIFKVGEKQTPILLVDRNFPLLDAHYVGSDDFKIGEIATEHLLETGRKRIAHIGASHLSTGHERMRGYSETLQRHRAIVPPEYVLMHERFEETGIAAGQKAMQQLLKLNHRPDAVFCYNDLTAIGAIEAVLEAGLRVPEDVAIVGCGNFRYAQYLRVPLTSVDQSTDQIGRTAGEEVIRLLDDPEEPARSILIQPHLRVRASSWKPA